MEATAKYEFVATADDELSFRKGEQLKILGTNDDWYKAEFAGNEGYVPKNYIDLHLPSWYQEDASRTDAQERLIQQPTGSFLIRGSQSSPGDFSISVRHIGLADVQHFKVLRNSRGQYHLWTEKFPSLNQLVDYYKANSISMHTRLLLLEMVEEQQGRAPKCNLPPVPVPRTQAQPPQPKAPPMQQVKALYAFKAEEKDELNFNPGDIIEVLDRSDPSWWKGRLQGRTGLFPSNYTMPV